METVETRNTDSKGRLTLPREFANSPVIIEKISDTELRIRKAVILPEEEVRFLEESGSALSNPERDQFLELLDNPPKVNAALRKAAQASKKQ